MGLVGGIVGSIGGLAGALLGIFLAVGLITMPASGIVFSVIALNLVAWLVILGFWLKERRKLERHDTDAQLYKEAIEVAQTMVQSLNRRRLHRELNGSVAGMLEESARNWSRIVGALGNTFWTSENLPVHWAAVRDQSAQAANRGMAELLVLCKTSFLPNNRGPQWQEVVEDVLETYVTGPLKSPNDLLPVSFDQAREIAERLKLLAGEVERASREISKDDAVMEGFRSRSALDMALSDLRSIQEAETELRQNLGG